ncbi:hypothetical protein [Pendulispora albinea]|uniref:DUF4394 domain-containing protein n=1 Tax=Pendulispora albinea TaxID=2741071 RepID=A0ABZ2M4P4_9BACT
MRRLSILGSAVLGGALVLGPLTVASCSDDKTLFQLPDNRTDASVTTDAGRDSADSGQDAGGPEYALFLGVDFSAPSPQLAAVSLGSKAVAGRLTIAGNTNVALAASGGHGFVLQRATGKLFALDPAQPWKIRATIGINDTVDSGPTPVNPHDVVVTAGAKAYVTRYARNTVTIIDAAAASVTGSLDLSEFVDPLDPDSLVDAQSAVYDPATKRAYFLLQRINQNPSGPFTPEDGLAPCVEVRGQIVAVDVTNDTLVDLNGAAPGKAINLVGDNPQALVPDFAAGRILVPDTGCFVPQDGGIGPRRGRGIEAVTLATATSSWLYQHDNLARLEGLVVADAAHAYVGLTSNFSDRKWFAWNTGATTLGSELSNFPKAPFYDGKSRIIGLAAKKLDAGASDVALSVVAWDVASSQLSTIAENPFEGLLPDLTYGVTSAHLR